jgi:hypothetical protein
MSHFYYDPQCHYAECRYAECRGAAYFAFCNQQNDHKEEKIWFDFFFKFYYLNVISSEKTRLGIHKTYCDHNGAAHFVKLKPIEGSSEKANSIKILLKIIERKSNSIKLFKL